jgi:hypothetical protein
MLKEIHMKDSVMDKVRRFLQVIYNGEYLVSHLQLSKCLLIAAALDIQGLTHEVSVTIIAIKRNNVGFPL